MTFYPFWVFSSEQSSLIIKSSLKYIYFCTYASLMLFVSLLPLLWLPDSCPSLAQATYLVCPLALSFWQEHRLLCHQCHKEMRRKVFRDSLPFCPSFSPHQHLPAKLPKMVTHQLSDPKKIPVQLQLQRWSFKSTLFCILREGKEDLCPRQTWALTGKEIEKIL